MTTKTAQLRSLSEPTSAIDWHDQSPLTREIETRQGTVTTRHGHFAGGASQGVEAIEVDTGAVRALILPSRGMSLWQLEAGNTRFGWQSPIAGPVHPALVPVFDPSGIGWLEGFDELLVRCGLESNGAPEHNSQGQLVYPLHGRIANLPATALAIEYNEASGRVEVIGEIIESRLFVKRWRLRSRIRFQAGAAQVDLLDDVTNDLAQPRTMQLLYHINLGPPALGAGAVLEAAVDELAPKDDRSAEEIDTWNQYGPPQTGYAERVYFARPRADENDLTTALLRAADGNTGFAVTMHTRELPRLVIWKHTAAESDGYVTGIEPATNFPNPRSYEGQQGRVVEIAPGATKSFRLSMLPLTSSAEVDQVSRQIKQLQGDQPAKIWTTPRPGWSPGA